MIDRRKLRVLLPCGDVSEPDCMIKGAHLTEEECIQYLNTHKYFENSKIEDVCISHVYMIKMETTNSEHGVECEGKYFWNYCGYDTKGAVPTTEVTICSYGN